MTPFETYRAALPSTDARQPLALAVGVLEAFARRAALSRPAELRAHGHALIESAPAAPLLRRLVRQFLHAYSPRGFGEDDEATRLVAKLVRCVERDHARLVDIGARLIAPCREIFTMGYCATVVRIAIAARRAGSPLRVWCTEGRPHLEGRRTAHELAGAGVPVTVLLDAAANDGLRHAGAVVLSAQSVLARGAIVGPVGTSLVALAAERHDVPLYVTALTGQFDASSRFGANGHVEMLDASAVWRARRPNVRVLAPAGEAVAVRHVEAFITELGVLDFAGFNRAGSRHEREPSEYPRVAARPR